MKPVRIIQQEYDKYAVLAQLNNLVDVPEAIYVVGNLELLNSKTLTVIGSRKISSYGEQVIQSNVPTIAQNDICIVSGVAYGCDYLSQKTAIDSGGTTIGVMGCGINIIKSHQHYKFIKECLYNNTGLFLSEFDPDMQPAKWTFIKRDRIMACLGEKLLVIEASEKSGTMHTVNFALELGKEVYSVPGNIYNSNSVGTNLLIQNGANVFLLPEDILDNYILDESNTNSGQISGNQNIILNLLDSEKTALEINRLSGLNINVVLSELTMLELKGLVTKVGDSWVRLQH